MICHGLMYKNWKVINFTFNTNCKSDKSFPTWINVLQKLSATQYGLKFFETFGCDKIKLKLKFS